MKALVYFITFIRFFNLVIAKNVFDITKINISGDERAQGIEKRMNHDQQTPQSFDEEYAKQREQQRLAADFSSFSTNLLSFKDPISIFTYYLRDNYDFIHTGPLKDIIIFIPTDNAIKKLSEKPWEFPSLIVPSMDEKTADKVSKENVLSFVKSHLVNISDLQYKLPEDGSDITFKTINNNDIIIRNYNSDFWASAERGSSRGAKIISSKVEKYAEQTITLIVIDGTLDWPEKH
ncbi:hypothetical protein DASC09_015190 [Saccharomycopsis crataegensis]|uniref:FAS1 domain-containing protein n=1 Tax=Saccharomycopsis crataegensis TaxID=43959 RepID=A0AAV5QHI1_9ASCO|nr:hypothetical protein DASC09_015190 [Saccharomycopsis crataegensis]